MPETPVLDSTAITAVLPREDGWESVNDVPGTADDHELMPMTLDFARLESADAIWKHCTLVKSFGPERAISPA